MEIDAQAYKAACQQKADAFRRSRTAPVGSRPQRPFHTVPVLRRLRPHERDDFNQALAEEALRTGRPATDARNAGRTVLAARNSPRPSHGAQARGERDLDPKEVSPTDYDDLERQGAEASAFKMRTAVIEKLKNLETPEFLVSQAQVNAIVETVLQQMPSLQRECVERSKGFYSPEGRDESIRAIARTTGLSRPAVEAAIDAGLEALRSELRRRGFTTPTSHH